MVARFTAVVSFLFLSCVLQAQDILIAGSDTLGAKLIPQLAEAYRKKHPDVNFQIQAEGTSTGFLALLEGDCEIGMASRPATPEEVKRFEKKNLQVSRFLIAHDMIAVIVHENNPVKNLSSGHLKDIFTGKADSWDGYGGKGPLKAMTRNTSSGTYKIFQHLALNGEAYGQHILKMAGSLQVHQEVALDPQLISYVGIAYANAPGLKPVALDGIPPTPANAHRYPLTRDLFLYTTQRITPEAQSFLEWVLYSPQARKVVSDSAFIPRQPKPASTGKSPEQNAP